jgi:hypothetical protein
MNWDKKQFHYLSVVSIFKKNEGKAWVYYIVACMNIWSGKPRLTAVRIRCADHSTHSTRKGWRLSDKRRCSVSIVRLRSSATELSFFISDYIRGLDW